HLAAIVRSQVAQVFIQPRRSEWWLGQVAMRGIPGHVSFEKQNLVPAPDERPNESSIACGVSVAPGGRNREPENHDTHWRVGGLGRLIFHEDALRRWVRHNFANRFAPWKTIRPCLRSQYFGAQRLPHRRSLPAV